MPSLLMVRTEDEETESIVVLNSVRPVRGGDSKKGGDYGTKSTVEKAKGRQNRISVGVSEDELPLSRNNHPNA